MDSSKIKFLNRILICYVCSSGEDNVTRTEIFCTALVLISTHGSVPASRCYLVELLTSAVIIRRYQRMTAILQSALKFLQFSTITSWYSVAVTLILRSYPFQNSASARCTCQWNSDFINFFKVSNVYDLLSSIFFGYFTISLFHSFSSFDKPSHLIL
jgi:hypothetical protein